MNLKFLKLLSVCLTLELMVISGVVQASWEAPTVAPPNGNRPRPLNVSDLPQEKTGALILSNATKGLIMRDQSPLVFGNPVGPVVGFKASTTAPTSDIIWTLPITDGINNSVLKTDGAGHLGWYNLLDLTTQDEDFGYKKNADNSNNSIGTKFFTRFLSTGIINGNMVLTNEANPSKFTGGTGDVFIENKLEVDGNAYLKNITASSLDLGFPTGVVPFQGTTSLAYDANNFFWDNTNKRLGIGTNTPNSKLHVYNTTQNAEIDLQSVAGAGNHWAIYNDSTSNELRFWKGAQNQLRISSAGKIGVNIGGDTFLSSEPFFLESAGDIGPHANNTYNLGSATTRWRTIFGTNLDLTGSLNLGFATGSVIFQGATGLAENNNKLFWNTTNDRLGIGTSTPTQILDVNGNINLANTTFNKTAGVLYMGGEVFMHSAAKSIQADPSWMTDYYSNTYVGRDAGSFPATVNDEISFYDNSALGFWALKNNQADSNTAIGSRSLFSNTSGWGNSALGVFSLTNNTIGILNSAVGYYALSSNISGNNNTAFGSNALAANLASNNTAFGNSSLSANTSGTHNTAVGIGAGQTNSTGYENLFLGDGSGDSNSVGNQNIYAGYLAGHLHASGDENVFLGHSAGYGNTSSTGTVAIGSGAGHNGNGSGNIFLGTKAGFYETGSYKLYIDSADRNADNALIYGKFYSAGDPNPMLRFNGRVGITPMGTANFTPNSLLHIYDPSGSNNAEIDIQSVSGANNHWGIYQNRTDSGLRFWNNNTAGNKDILSLALIGATTKYGAVGIGTGTSTPPNSLLHLYQTDSSAPNAELDIQSFANDVSGGVAQQRQWSMYQDRTTKQLRFWNAFAGSFATTSETYTYNLNSPYNNLLMLTDYGSVGIGMHSNNIPLGRLEVHSVGENSLTLSSYNSNYSGGGGNSINFVGVLTKADGSKDKGVSTQLFSSFSDVSSDSTFGIKLPDPTSGALYDKAVFTNPLFTFSPSNRAVFTSKVNVGGIHSDTPNNYTLAVTGSIHGDDYYAGDNSQGATAYLCLGIPSGSGISAVRLRFVDGLYVCSCGAGSLCPGNNCTCN